MDICLFLTMLSVAAEISHSIGKYVTGVGRCPVLDAITIFCLEGEKYEWYPGRNLNPGPPKRYRRVNRNIKGVRREL
jgi:hypothetical protein